MCSGSMAFGLVFHAGVRVGQGRLQGGDPNMGVSEKRGPEYSTLNSRVLIIRTPKNEVPLIFRKLPY